MHHRLAAAALLAATLLLTACGGASSADVSAGGDQPTTGGGMAMCAQGVTECDDMVVGEGTTPDGTEPDAKDAAMSDEDYRARAKSYLGKTEAEVGPVVRVSRRGEETMMLTEDYVLGRSTVELDDDGTGTYVVTSVTVELSDGPETYTD